ncbi:MAG TPA: COQ9 family protein [Rhizomicrobium sp.]|jgi:ubiquinone biosynthesis protein COQ9|nr:COQ9 family protein [Rhizomicrobium sp.]
MSDAPKKPVKRKATPKVAAAKLETKARGMSDQEMREAVLARALPHAAFDGFTDSVLQKAGDQAGVTKTDLARLFEDGPISLVEFYSTSTDAEMEKRLAATDLKAMKIRERIATAVKTRLSILKPHKEAARRAASLLSLPMHAALGAKLVYRTVDAMWRAAGDTSTDFNFYTKRGILAGVYGSTAMRWFNDTSEDEKPTEDFLAARIDNVMQFEKFKSKAKEALSNFPMFADWAKPKAK